ncbi:MAG: hypothetical protein B6D64_02890 [Bacteroidetes bacterium 4484_276]|nr:MAG: hypothetical protein B6D64_02890 [Bacteroidetes bacterium 4484_276]OYT13901.1 MAG: transcriptional regulator [Bacteroidetes bacterium 4572_114]
MDRLAINNILRLNELGSELEHERASSLFLRLRKLEQEDSSYVPIREHLKNLMLKYEQKYWSDESKITDGQIKESDLAELFIQAENEFHFKRKELIKNKLKKLGLNQNDLARILGHRKGYMSELINGLRPFSKDDIVIINRLLKINLNDLVPLFIKQEKVAHIKRTLKTISNSKIRLTKIDFDPQFV